MSEDLNRTEKNSGPLDISSRIIEIIDDPEDKGPKTFIIDDYLQTLRKEHSLSITMDWRGIEWARWAKAFKENPQALSNKQDREVTIKCTESQKREAANVFASGVKWINSEKSSEV
jgi:hypothetical protein